MSLSKEYDTGLVIDSKIPSSTRIDAKTINEFVKPVIATQPDHTSTAKVRNSLRDSTLSES